MQSESKAGPEKKMNSPCDEEVKYRFLYEKSPIGIFQFDRNAVITECNDRFLEIIRSERERVVGLNLQDLIDQSILPAIENALNGKQGSYQGPYRTTTSDVRFYISLKATPLTDSSGKDIGGMAIVEDITAQTLAMQRLAKKEEDFRILSSLTTDAASILTINPQGTFEREWLSVGLLEEMGYKPEDIDSFEKWAAIVYPDDLPLFRDAVAKITKGEPVSQEFRVRAKDGKVYWICNTVYPEYDAKGNPVRLISAVRNITERKEYEMKITNQRNLLDSIVENAPVGIWLTDSDGSFSILNSHFARSIGYGTDQFSLTPREIEQCKRSDELAKETKGPISVTEEITFVDGIKHTLCIFKTPLYSADGGFLGVLGIAVDDTDRIVYQKALVQALEKAEESDRLKSAFLANMSHEIRTPLNGVIGFAKYLKDFPDTAPEERLRFLNIISSSADHLLMLINDIIDISKIDTGQLTINLEHVNVNDLMDEVYTFYFNSHPGLAQRGIAFTFSVALPDSEAVVMADRLRLRQVLTNLVGNALKFTEQGSVTFGYRVSDDSNMLEFYVTDTGIGIEPDKQEVIFHHFRQADDSIARNYGGTGLGLAICKSLVQLMGGTITVDSEKGKGSTFSFTLPFQTVRTEGPDVTSDINPKPALDFCKGKVALIAEDEKNSLLFLETVLGKIGFTCILAENGLEALEKFRQAQRVDIVIVDLKMPGLGGIETAKQIKALCADVPVIIQSAHAFNDERQLCQAIGCSSFITKPIDPANLYRVVCNELKRE